jgi:hypothetical protein
MRILSSLSVALLIFNSAAFAGQPALDSETQQGKETETAQAVKIKAQVQKRGAGEKSRVRVTLGNGTVVKGYISKIDDSSFDVNGSKSGQATSISYTDVQKIQGPGLSTGAKVGIGVAIGVAIVVVVIVVELARTGYLR